ncbi:MAG: hypothetical protein RIB84_20575 [Sneathiellaceae bacterium]
MEAAMRGRRDRPRVYREEQRRERGEHAADHAGRDDDGFVGTPEQRAASSFLLTAKGEVFATKEYDKNTKILQLETCSQQKTYASSAICFAANASLANFATDLIPVFFIIAAL